MKTKTIEINIPKEYVRVLEDPAKKGHKTTYAYVKIADLPMDLPLEVNPRNQNTKSRVARQIANGLIDDTEVFHVLNRGLTLTVLSSKYNNASEKLSLEVAGGYYGVLDGGHSYSVIREQIQPYLENPSEEKPDFFNGFVKMEIIEGVKSNLLVDLARARNTSAQVKDESLANLEGSFDWLKDELAKTSFGEKVAYKENEDDEAKPIDVREIISLLTIFHPNFQDSDNPPVMAYSSKGRCLELFRNEPEGYQKLRPIIPDILKLYDYIHLKLAPMYEEVGGFSGMGEEDKRKSKQVKLAKVTEVKRVKEGFPLYYLNETGYYHFPNGWLYPLVGAHRALVSYKTVARFKAEPQRFFDKYGKKLVVTTLEASKQLGRNPNAVGKSQAHWTHLMDKVSGYYTKLLGIDTDKDIVL